VSLRTDELDYDLPSGQIATKPVEPRDSARMLVLRRSSEQIDHRQVRDLPDYLEADDVMVFNNTTVLPARLQGRRVGTSGRVEGLFLEEISCEPLRWKVLLKAGGKLHPDDSVELLDSAGRAEGIRLRLMQRDAEQWVVEVGGARSTIDALERVGLTPLPPYILKARGGQALDDSADRQWYQTVYAQAHSRGSVAAPTAGLHFTPELLNRIDQQGVRRFQVTLHVGQGTFKPVTAETLAEHRMHSEWFEIPGEVAQTLARRHARVLAVGTTSMRTLEAAASRIFASKEAQMCGPVSGMTDLLIAPPYEFQVVQGMLTNFHLPRSTLLALVAAMVGLDRLKAAYQEAIALGYRFYSYGDAMLILP
jgi:S-adenosylmethionine:tRNA ribosyltransferase-isomerase